MKLSCRKIVTLFSVRAVVGDSYERMVTLYLLWLLCRVKNLERLTRLDEDMSDVSSLATTKGETCGMSSSNRMELALKRELEATKCALKIQTMRCRQLVAAFTKKLYDKEQELKASQSLRDQQLGRLLRALLVLESRLKKEQKLIRRQLQEKDFIIQKQEKEICKFKSEAREKWQFPIAEEAKNLKDARRHYNTQFSLGTGEERLDNLCKGLSHSPLLSPLFRHTPKTESKGIQFEGVTASDTLKKEQNSFKDNPVLESVNQILLRDEEDLLKVAQPVRVDFNEKTGFVLMSDSSEWYETSSNCLIDGRTDSGDRQAKHLHGEENVETKTRKDFWPGEKTSPVKSQHLEEKACLEMAKKNLIAVNLGEIDAKNSSNVDRASSPAKSTASYEEIIPVVKTSEIKSFRNSQKPPALPPKPARLLKPSQILQQKSNSGNLDSRVLPPGPHEEATATKIATTVVKSNQSGSSGKKTSKNGIGSDPVAVGNHHIQSRSECELLEGRSKSHDSNSKPKRHTTTNYASGSSEVAEHSGATHFARQKKIEEIPGSCIKIGSSVSSLITGLAGETIVTEIGGESATSGDDSHVSQLVRQFEDLGKSRAITSNRTENEVNDLRQNFEEFKLEESYGESLVEGIENGRHDGDGAENRNSAVYYAALTIATPSFKELAGEPECKMYETFLENTGLSQKSILTPSRMLSNHRSCLKPKDVKHRSRVKAAAAIEKCTSSTFGCGSTVKYWTEPFL